MGGLQVNGKLSRVATRPQCRRVKFAFGRTADMAEHGTSGVPVANDPEYTYY